MSVLIKGLNIKPCKDGFGGKGLPAQRSYEDGVRKGYEDAVRNYAKTALTQWVPVSERLPDDGREVWVTIKGYDVIYVEEGETLEQALERISRIRWVTKAYWSEEEHGWNNTRFGCPLVVSPIAWMPMKMPEPYKD